MAPKKQQQHKGSAKAPSKSKGHTSVSKFAPKLQISAENERRLRRLLINNERPHADAAPAAPPVAVGTRAQKAKRLRSVYDKLSLEGFTSDQIEQALSVLNEVATFETALDWLCLNIPGNELPLKFSSGEASSTNEGDRSVRIISTARADWVPTQHPKEEVKEGTSGVSVRFKGKRDEESLDFGKSSQAAWIRQYLETQEEEEDEHVETEKEADHSSHAVSISEEYRQARLGALEAKQKGDRASQKHYSEIINKLKQEFTSLGLSENDLESELQNEIANLKMQEMPSDHPQGLSLESKPPDDAKFESKNAVSAFVVDSSSLEELDHAIGSLVHTVPEECQQKEEPEELELDNLFSEDSSSSGALPSEVLKQQKKDKLLQPAYGQILGNIDEIWKKDDPGRIPKAVLQKLCQRLGWEAPKYNRVSAIENKFLYSVSVLRTASGRGKSRKAGGLITFHLPNQDEAFRSTEEAQNRVAAFALYQLFPDLPFNQLLIEPYASFITKRLEEVEFSAKVEDNEDNRRAGFVDSLLAAGVSQPIVSKDAKDESVCREMLVDLLSKYSDHNFLVEKAKVISVDGLSYHEQLESNLLKEELQNKTKNPKYMKMLESRGALPIAMIKDNLLQVLCDNDVIVVSGETGSGKTTQVPQFILDDMIKSGLGGGCNIICTQPRRIAAMSVAERVSDERCEYSPGGDGSLVGYQVRLESVRNERTKLLFCTTGILLRKLSGDGKKKDKLESWFADMKQPFNMHAMHSAVIKSILCAGLYPNVVATIDGTVGVPLGSNKAPSNNISTNDCSLWFDGKREVHLHPSSMNYNIKGFQYPFLVFLEKVETSKVFLRDTSIISPYSLLLFGGSISVQHQMGLVIIDSWLKLTAPAQTAVLFKELRSTLHAVLKDLIRKPEMMSVSNNEVVNSIVHLLLEEGTSQRS